MALTLTEKFRMTAGGRAWRTFDIVHDSATTKTLSAASLDLNYIEAIIGVNTKMSMVAVASNLLDQIFISIAGDGAGLIWPSTSVCTQTVTVVGW